MKQLAQNEQKELAAVFAVRTLFERGLIFSGMKIGLGTGSTAMPAVREFARLLQAGKISGVSAAATSFQTEIACEELGIPLFALNSRQLAGSLDLVIDGADEVDGQKRLIKGGGAALLREKIIAYNAARFVIVADESKKVDTLGTKFSLPVEIIAEARVPVIRCLEQLGASCVLREGVRKCGPVITDCGHLIVDCLWKTPVDAALFEEKINAITGVVENGFFTKNPPLVFVGKADGTVEELD